MKKMNNKGFSLVELIIVIAIMAILVGVLAPQFVKYVEQSRESSDLQAVEECKTAIETYVADYGCTGSATVAPGGKGTGISWTVPTDSGASGSLTDYGITGTIEQKSAYIKGFTWTYSNFSWTCSNMAALDNTSGGAPYYKVNGEKN